MNRRDVLRYAGLGAGSMLLNASFSRLAQAEATLDPKACFAPFDAEQKTFEWKTKPAPYKVAVGNSFVSNDWRAQMIKVGRAYAAEPAIKSKISDFTVNSSGPDVSAQIAQFEQLILQGVDLIVTNAASPTGLNDVIAEAADAGILVVSFDNVVTSPRAMAVNHDQMDMGRIWAQFIAEQTNGKGKVLFNRGIAGTFGDEVFSKGGLEIFGKYPGIELIQVNGDWDQGTSQKVTADALAAGHKFDGVWSEYGDTGVVRAFLQSGKDVPPCAGQSENGFRKLAAEHKFPMLSAGVAPGLIAAAMAVGFAVMEGQKVPRSVKIPLDPIKTQDLKAGVNYFPDLPDSFVAGYNVPLCGVDVSIADVLKQTT